MINDSNITAKDIKMLELLTQGASSKDVARDLGYKEGTMRVYLHNLYRKLGVNTKTAAVAWYLASSPRTVDGSSDASAVAKAPEGEETFGDMALRSSLFSALGIMSIFFGGHGRMWEVANRLKGNAPDARSEQLRRTSRLIWEAYLAGDFAHAKRLYERGHIPKLFIDSPQDCMLAACMLLVGGYSNAADRVIVQLKRRTKGSLGISANEHKLVLALRDAINHDSEEALGFLYHLASENTAQQVFKHCALTALYYAYVVRHDFDRARATANAIYAEADSVRQHLQAMGEKPLYQDATLPQPTVVKKAELRGYLEKLEKV